LSWYSPQPRQKPKRLPRRRPIKVVPSGIGDQGIVANYLMYYLKGGDHLHDFSPEKNHGTINEPVWKDGQYGWSLDFPDSSNYVTVPNDASLNPSSVTVAYWMKIFVTTWQILFEKSNQYALTISGGGQAYFHVYVGGTEYTCLAGPDLGDGLWHFLVGTYDGETAKLYVDGSQVDSTTDPSGALDTTGNPIKIGGTATNFDSILNMISIYSIAKSSSWISRRFQRTKGIFGL